MDAVEPLSDQTLDAAANELAEALKALSPDVRASKRLIAKGS